MNVAGGCGCGCGGSEGNLARAVGVATHMTVECWLVCMHASATLGCARVVPTEARMRRARMRNMNFSGQFCGWPWRVVSDFFTIVVNLDVGRWSRAL